MKNRTFKKILSIFLVFSLIITLPIAQTKTTEAASNSVKIKYDVNGGFFKNTKYKGKKIVTKKVSKGSKRGSSFKVKRENYVFLGWYTKKKGGKKYTSSTKVTKNLKLYARWTKRYKVNKKYAKILGINAYLSLDDLEADTGMLHLIDSNTKYYPYKEIYESKNGDLYYTEKRIHGSGENAYTYYTVIRIVTKAKNVVNIQKTTKYNKFFKKLGVSKYNTVKKNNKIIFDFICGISNIIYQDPEDSDWQYVNWKFSTNSKKKIKPSTKITLDLIEEWEEL
ncbi:MAG: InlB B-repeat-containing protein [Eubacterium sp.]